MACGKYANRAVGIKQSMINAMIIFFMWGVVPRGAIGT
jgi:hypothetical protein